MNNRFKFRVYDPTKKMLIYFELDNIIVPYNLLCQDKYPVQQNTGLIDKNNNPIYEGDIITALHDFGPAGFAERTAVINWDNINGYQWQYWDLDSIEVIGNIFNPPCNFDVNGECIYCDSTIDDCQFKSK
jgi:hypothetical protein